jgi:hypothetical protein
MANLTPSRLRGVYGMRKFTTHSRRNVVQR